MQVDVRAEHNGTGVPDAAGHDKVAAAHLVELVDGTCEGVGAELRTVAHGSEVLQVDKVVGKLGCCHFWHDKRQVGRIDAIGVVIGTSVLVIGFSANTNFTGYSAISFST